MWAEYMKQEAILEDRWWVSAFPSTILTTFAWVCVREKFYEKKV